MAGITLKQLSELSGLSIRTVSRVLKGQAHVIPEKRDLILELARKHHYIPNMAARNLRLNRTNIVGIICANMMPGSQREETARSCDAARSMRVLSADRAP